MNAIVNTKDLRVEFRANSISLDVPPSGVTTEDDSWTIAPMGHPEVYYCYTITYMYCALVKRAYKGLEVYMYISRH